MHHQQAFRKPFWRIALAAVALALAVPAAGGEAVAATSQRADRLESLTATLVALEQERQAAFVSGDRAVLERHFATEYNHTNLRGGLTNRTQELDFFGPGSFRLENGTVSDVTVHDYGETAVLLGTIDWRGAILRVGGREIDLSGLFRVTRLYVWRDGRWQVATSHASQIPPARPPAA